MAKALEKVYREYNKAYFGGTLPRVPVRWSEQIDPTHRSSSRQAYGWYTPTEETDGVILIAAALKRQPMLWRFTLLHEACHVKLRHLITPDTIADGSDHGPEWQAEMKRLAASGAFASLW